MKTFGKVGLVVAILMMITFGLMAYGTEKSTYQDEIESLYQSNEMNQKTIKQQYQIMTNQQKVIDSLMLIKSHTVTATVYYPTGDKTASDMVIPEGYTQRGATYKIIAVSHDLLVKNGGFLKFGDKIKVCGTKMLDGIYRVEDTTHKRFRNRVDILVSGNINEMWKNVKITKV